MQSINKKKISANKFLKSNSLFFKSFVKQKKKKRKKEGC